jgi:hypothetical protein
MAFQPPISIFEAIQNIDDRKYLLPAIQRDFTWWEDQIRWLFDSLMQGYPINSLLLWEVEGDTKGKFKFYEILRDYVERHRNHNEDEFQTKGRDRFFGILDGQQRLTSMYIGLKGTFAWHKYYASWTYSEESFPRRRLYICITEKAEDDDEAQEYLFRFLTDSQYQEQKEKWFLVGDILDIRSTNDLINLIRTNPKLDTNIGSTIISRLHEVVHTEKPINCYVEKSQDIDKALNIFIRINKNGTPLNFSDLVMSNVVAHWEGDAKKAINGLADEIFRNLGFYITKDFILKAYLYLCSDDIRFKVNNFTKDNALDFEKRWADIRTCVLAAFSVAKQFGFYDDTLTSKFALLPILYHIYKNQYFEKYVNEVRFGEDKKNVKKWLHIVLMKQINISDTFLRHLRELLNTPNFPVKIIISGFTGTNQDMKVDDDFIEIILKTQKDHPRAFSILALLYHYLDYRNGDFHKDHLHPASYFTDKYLSEFDIPDNDLWFYKDANNWNSICNLQLLDSNENMSKNNAALKQWVDFQAEKLKISPIEFCNKRMIPMNIDFLNFKEFIEERKQLLKEAIKELTQF